MAETTFILNSYEWTYIKPAEGKNSLIGDTIWLDANTDIDSIVVSWGDTIKYYNHLKNLGLKNREDVAQLQAWRVVHNNGDYSIKMAQISIPK